MRAITSIYLTRMKNEAYVQFHDNVKMLMLKRGLNDFPFKKLFEPYSMSLNNEEEALLIITKSELTAKIVGQNKVRGGIFRGFSDVVWGLRNHFYPEHRSAAKVLWSLLKHYGNVTRKSLDAETAAINDLIREFQREEIHEAIETLGMTDWVEHLTLENDRFNQLMMARDHEAVSKTTFRMKTARVETDKYYRAIVANIENQVLIDDVSPALHDFIIELNAMIKRFKNTMAHEEGRIKRRVVSC